MSRRYADEDWDDYVDRVYEDDRQRNADAYSDGRKVGLMGLGAGLCPQGYSNDERIAWLRGFHVGAAELLAQNKRAA